MKKTKDFIGITLTGSLMGAMLSGIVYLGISFTYFTWIELTTQVWIYIRGAIAISTGIGLFLAFGDSVGAWDEDESEKKS